MAPRIWSKMLRARFTAATATIEPAALTALESSCDDGLGASFAFLGAFLGCAFGLASTGVSGFGTAASGLFSASATARPLAVHGLPPPSRMITPSIYTSSRLHQGSGVRAVRGSAPSGALVCLHRRPAQCPSPCTQGPQAQPQPLSRAMGGYTRLLPRSTISRSIPTSTAYCSGVSPVLPTVPS